MRAINTDVPVRVSDAQLAVLLRQAQWALDDAAHEFPAGRATPGQRMGLAAALEALALLLRASAPEPAGRPGGQPGGEACGSAHPSPVGGEGSGATRR